MDANQIQRQQAFEAFVTAFQDDLKVNTAQQIADDLDVSFYVEEIA
jgi:hypothetical protein